MFRQELSTSYTNRVSAVWCGSSAARLPSVERNADFPRDFDEVPYEADVPVLRLGTWLPFVRRPSEGTRYMSEC